MKTPPKFLTKRTRHNTKALPNVHRERRYYAGEILDAYNLRPTKVEVIEPEPVIDYDSMGYNDLQRACGKLGLFKKGMTKIDLANALRGKPAPVTEHQTELIVVD